MVEWEELGVLQLGIRVGGHAKWLIESGNLSPVSVIPFKMERDEKAHR